MLYNTDDIVHLRNVMYIIQYENMVLYSIVVTNHYSGGFSPNRLGGKHLQQWTRYEDMLTVKFELLINIT